MGQYGNFFHFLKKCVLEVSAFHQTATTMLLYADCSVGHARENNSKGEIKICVSYWTLV